MGPLFRPGDRVAFVTERFGSETIAVLDDERNGSRRHPGHGPRVVARRHAARVYQPRRCLRVAAAGGSAVNLTKDALGYYAPVWSPDGGASHLAERRSPDIPARAISEVVRTTQMISVYRASASTSPTSTAPRTTYWPLAATPTGSSPRRDGPWRPSRISAADRPASSMVQARPIPTARSRATPGNLAMGRSGSGPTPHHAYAIGDRYVVSLTVTDDTGTTGALNRTIDANAPPMAVLAVACSGPTCSFDASGSADPDGTIASYSLSFGDGHSTTFSTNSTASHTYATGTFTANLYVQDNGGAVAVRTTTVTVTNMLPIATFTDACNAFTCGFDGSGAADVDGTIQYYGWTFGDGSGGSGATTSHRYAAAGTYVVTLTVFDNTGQRTVVSRI